MTCAEGFRAALLKSMDQNHLQGLLNTDHWALPPNF